MVKSNPLTQHYKHEWAGVAFVWLTVWLPDRTLSGNAGGISVFAGSAVAVCIRFFLASHERRHAYDIDLTFTYLCVRILMYSERPRQNERETQMAIHTLSVEINYRNGDKLNPIYECHSVEKFEEFVAWHKANLPMNTTTLLKAYDYNTTTPELTEMIIK